MLGGDFVVRLLFRGSAMFLPSQIRRSCFDDAHLWWIGDDLKSSAGFDAPDGDPWRSGGDRVPFLEFYADRGR